MCEYANIDESGDKVGAVAGNLQNSYYRSAIISNCSAFSSVVSADRDAGRILGCLNFDDFGTQTLIQDTMLSSDSTVELVYNKSGYNDSPKSGSNIEIENIGIYD